MRLFLIISAFHVICFGALAAQTIRVNFNISPSKDTLTISPYIYGSNGQGDDRSANITARRLGGNRLTGYNWENNASNAGTDYYNHSDNYLTYGLPESLQYVPAIVPILFHRDSKVLGAYSLVTLPAAGYVARDKAGNVDQNQTAPSNRWREVRFAKQTPFVAPPDTTDNYVFVDEEVSYLNHQLGTANDSGIRGYDCDNEPALWPSTHPRIHPAATTCAEVIARDSALALAVKAVDPKAEIFGPVSYGFEEYLTNQSAPDWNNYKSYGRWLNAYLAKMKEAETAAGKRLLDVLDLHWYPEAQGPAPDANHMVRVALSDNTSPGVARARMDAPRTLWDSSYKENSWIAQYYSPVALLPWLNSAIRQYYPGTKLAFTEINYGGDHHISGAIAMTDVLGIFGRYGVYMSNYWGTVTSFVASAYRMYTNYDGNNSKFGDRSVHATTDNIDSNSIYASVNSKKEAELHLIAINKSSNTITNARFTIDSKLQYNKASVYILTSDTTEIRKAQEISITGNTFDYALPALSVSHFVLQASVSGIHGNISTPAFQIVSAEFIGNDLRIRTTQQLMGETSLCVMDLLGRTIFETNGQKTSGEILLHLPTLPAGCYFIRVTGNEREAYLKVIK